MKRLIAVLLVAMMVLAMGAAYAESGGTEKLTDTPSVDLAKIYKLKNKDTKNPEETFKFKLETVGVAQTSFYTDNNMPFAPMKEEYEIAFTEGEATVAGDTNTTTITLPTYEHVGIFTYKITEQPGTTAGVDYDTNPIIMVVSVTNDPDVAGGFIRTVALHYGAVDGSKTQNITNTFYASGNDEEGGLQVTKEVTGNVGERDRYFPIVVTLTAPAAGTKIEVEDGVEITFPGTDVRWDLVTINSSELTASGKYGSNAELDFTQPTAVVEGENTFYLKHGQTVKLGNLPYGVTYTVSEARPDEGTENAYDEPVITYSDDTNKMIDTKEADTVNVLNNRDQQIDTGITLETLPYILVLGLALVGAVLMIARRRRNNED